MPFLKLLASLAIVAPAAATVPPRPNIVLILSDDHGKQAISCYGATAAPGLVSTPGIDRLAREGMRFDRASVTNAICGPSRAVILTGKHSHRNGFATNDGRFDGSQVTFPKLLQAAGYRTEIVGKWHLGSAPTGFDRSDVLLGQGDYWNPTFLVDGEKVTREGHATDLIHDGAIARLRELADGAKAGRPFALLVQHKAPHRNWMPQPRFFPLFRDAEIPVPPSFFDPPDLRSAAGLLQTMQVDRDLAWEYDLKVPARRLLPDEKPAGLDRWMENELARIPAAARSANEEAYRAENEAFIGAFPAMDARSRALWRFQRYAKDYLRTAQGVDESVGGILDELDRLGLAADTMVVYSSDQGWYLGESGWFDKRWMYEPSFRTPLVVRWPGRVPAGSVSRALVQNLDLAPTFLDAAGVAIPADMQGKSLRPLFASGGAGTTFREAAYYRFEESRGSHTVPRHEGTVTPDAKIIRYLDLKDAAGKQLVELYDLVRDPAERENLAGKPGHGELERRMLATLERVRSEIGAP